MMNYYANVIMLRKNAKENKKFLKQTNETIVDNIIDVSKSEATDKKGLH